MEDFSKYFQSMIESLLKSGSGEISFDIKAFDSKNVPDFLKELFEKKFDKREKLAVRKLTEEELEQYKSLVEQEAKIQSQLKRLAAYQKKLDIDYDLFWQDVQENSDRKLNPRKLSVDLETGFLFETVKINEKKDEEIE
ncbi:MAG: hypothetical protein U0457_14065 [Candidatus Sericytochromatia bacterium]